MVAFSKNQLPLFVQLNISKDRKEGLISQKNLCSDVLREVLDNNF